MSARKSRLHVPRPDSWTITWIATLLAIEFVLIAGYLAVTNARITDPFPTLVYPMVWIDASLIAIATTAPVAATKRRRRFAAAAAIGYGLVLFIVGGVFTPGHLLHGHAHASGLTIQLVELPPGWNPALFYGGAYLSVAIIPYKVVGYLALGYLVYRTLLELAGSAVLGLAGLFSCVSCTWPVVGAVITGAFGGAAGAYALNHSYTISTIVFLSALGLLYWHPGR